MSQDKLFIRKRCLGGPISWVVWSLGDLQVKANSVFQVDGASVMAPVGQLCGSVAGGRFRIGTVASAHLSVWEKAVHQLLP